MKIVYIATSIIPSRTANSIHVMKMCQAFAQNGHEISLLVPDPQEDQEQGVDDIFAYYGVNPCFEIIRQPWWSTKVRRLIFGWFATREAKTICPDIVYSRDVVSSYFAAIQGLPVIFESHAPVRDSGKVSDWMFCKLILMTKFQKLVVITHALKDYYLENYPLSSGKTLVAPDGADPLSNDILPVTLSKKSKRLQVGYVGHLYPGRGIDLIKQLANRCPWADFHVVGGMEQDINSCKMRTDSLENLYLHGFKKPSVAAGYCLGCDVLLAPYQYKISTAGGRDTVTWMSPMKIFEYMAAGKAIIVSDLPALREVLDHEETALLCSPDDLDTWIAALERINNDRVFRNQIGERARQRFLREYTWKSRADKVLAKNRSE